MKPWAEKLTPRDGIFRAREGTIDCFLRTKLISSLVGGREVISRLGESRVPKRLRSGCWMRRWVEKLTPRDPLVGGKEGWGKWNSQTGSIGLLDETVGREADAW